MLTSLFLALGAHAGAASPQAEAMLKQQSDMQAALAASPLRRPLVVDSAELPEGMRGDVYAVVEHPFDEVAQALAQPGHWCDMLMLHVNNRRCKVSTTGTGGQMLTLGVVRRYDQGVDQAFTLPLAMRVDSSAPDCVTVELSSAEGPLGTRNHYVLLEAVGMPGGQSTFLHFRYAYDHTLIARLATQAFLATFGSHKVGFTVVGTDADGAPEYIRGLRGLVERNAMRYFLTVDAYLDTMRMPAQQQAEGRMKGWFASTERYPRQLREVDRATYLVLKRSDRARGAAGRSP